MEIAKNELRIDLRANAKLKEIYSRMADGEKGKIEIEFVKKSMTGEAMIATIESIAPSGYSEKDPVTGEKEKDVDASTEEPMMVEITSSGEED